MQHSASIGGAFREAKSVEYLDIKLYEFYGAPKPDGVTEKGLTITLPRNAVVRKYEVIMTAAPAHAVRAGDAGQVRTTPVFGGQTAVLDFGTPRTVSAIQAPQGVVIKSVATWIGTEFDARAKFSSESGQNFVQLASEVRTERLQLSVSGSTSTEALATETVLVLPESPAGIELRIDGAAAVFSQPAAVEAGNSTALSTQAWNSASQRVFDLGPALAALTGDPLDESDVTFTVTLTSRVPGTLDLAERADGQDVLRVRRAVFNGQTTQDVVFDAEGQTLVALESMPADLDVSEVRLTVVGAPPALRTVPPLGPDAPQPAFAEFALTPERAAALLLSVDTRFSELHGVRVPLAAGSAGAEARVLLWQSLDLEDRSPVQPLENGASEPVSLGAGPEDWRTFTFARPIAVPDEFALWAVVVVNRGSVTTTFADGVGAERFLWGAPSGPWHDLPTALGSARGRVRVVGKPKPNAVFPPLRVALGVGALAADVTPNAKGTPVVMTGAGAVQTGATSLILTSHAAGTFTLRDIDVVSRN